MKLTNPEKLILVMLADLHEKLGIDSTDTKLLKAAIYSDNTWALSWEMQGIVADKGDPTPPAVSEVVDILDMWTFIEETAEKLDSHQKAELATTAPKARSPKFPGFDGNNEGDQFSIAKFLVEDMGRFSRFKGRELNSHHHTLDGYRAMLAIWKTTRTKLADRRMTVAELAALLNAGRAA